ncbi:MAG: HEPN domain-containing protein [bacterium]
MTEAENKIEVMKYWLEKSNESLESARREYSAGSLSFAANRIYYSAFYAVSALLLTLFSNT